MSRNRILLTSNDVELKGTIVRKRNRSQQSQMSVDDDTNGKNSSEIASNLNDLPSDIIEKILSHFSYKKMLHFRLVSRRWNIAISDYILHSRMAFKHYLDKFQIEWINLSTNCEEMIRNIVDCPHEVIERCSPFRLPPRFNQNALYHSGFMYIFGGVVSNQTAFNDLWRFDLTRRKWQRIIVNGDIPPPKIWTSLHYYEFEDPMTGLKKPSFIQMGHFSLFSPNAFNVTQERQLEQQEYSLIYVFDIQTLTWRKLKQNGDLRICLTGKFSSFITGNELLILCGAVSYANDTSHQQENMNVIANVNANGNTNGKFVVYSFDLKACVWSIQKSAQNSMSRSQFDSMIPLNEHLILFHHQRKLFLFERNRCSFSNCPACLDRRGNEKRSRNSSLDKGAALLDGRRRGREDRIGEDIKNGQEEAEEEIVWTCSKCDVITSEGDMRLFFNAKSAVYFQVDKHKFGAVLLRQIRLTLPPPPPIISQIPTSMKPPSLFRSTPGIRDGERLAKLDRYMDKLNHQFTRQNERMAEILDVEFFDSRQLLKERLLRPICDQSVNFQRTKLFSCFSGMTFGSSYLPTVTLTPEGLLVFGGCQGENGEKCSSMGTSSGSSAFSGSSVPPRSDFYMLIARPDLNRRTSQMKYK